MNHMRDQAIPGKTRTNVSSPICGPEDPYIECYDSHRLLFCMNQSTHSLGTILLSVAFRRFNRISSNPEDDSYQQLGAGRSRLRLPMIKQNGPTLSHLSRSILQDMDHCFLHRRTNTDLSPPECRMWAPVQRIRVLLPSRCRVRHSTVHSHRSLFPLRPV
jgi:hypothetical protein